MLHFCKILFSVFLRSVCVCVCSDGKGDVHCQKEVGNGSLPQYWAWLVDATYLGKFTYHEVDYDAWGVYVRNTIFSSR